MLTECLGWLEHTSLSSVIRQSHWAVMALEAIHLLGLALLGGAAVIASLRSAELPLRTLVNELRPLGLVGVGLAISLTALVHAVQVLQQHGLPLENVVVGRLIDCEYPVGATAVARPCALDTIPVADGGLQRPPDRLSLESGFVRPRDSTSSERRLGRLPRAPSAPAS